MIAECQSGRACVGFDVATGTPMATALDGTPLCTGCLGRAEADIASLPGDHRALSAELVPAGGASNAPHVSGGEVEAPVPIALAVDALMRDIAWTLAVWEPPVREAAGLPVLDEAVRVRPAVAVRRGARLIAERIPLLARLGPTWGYADGLDAGPVERDGVEAITALRALHLSAGRVLGATPLTRSMPGLCASCGSPALRRVDGTDPVVCGVCGFAQTYDDYRGYSALVIGAGDG